MKEEQKLLQETLKSEKKGAAIGIGESQASVE